MYGPGKYYIFLESIHSVFSVIISCLKKETDKRQTGRNLQLQRLGTPNHLLGSSQITSHCHLDERNQQLMEQAISRLGLSARAYHRILKVARTIADLAGRKQISKQHLSEAIGYRRLDRGQQ